MTTITEEVSDRIARRLRLERDSRSWSLADLAERSGVSKATISKIERAEVSPTAVVLVRLAAAFELTLAGLMLRAEGQGERLARASDQPIWRDPKPGICANGVQPAIIPSRSSGSNSRPNSAWRSRPLPTCTFAEVVWAGRQARHHRGRRAARAWNRRLSWFWFALRGDLRQQKPPRLASMSSYSPGADRHA